MGILKLPKRFHPDFALPQKKPIAPIEIDWSNPLTRGLALAYIPTLTAPLVNLVGGQSFKLVGTSLPTVNLRDGAVSGDFGGVNDNFSIATEITKGVIANELSVFARSRPEGAGDYFGAQDGVFFSNRASGNQGLTYSHGLAIGGSPNPGSPTFTIQGVAVYDSTVSSLDGSSFQTHGMVAVSGASVDFIADGVITENVAIGTFTTGDTLWTVGAEGDSGTLELFSSVEFVLVWTRALTPAEFKIINEDPYQILKPVVPQVYFPVTADAGLNISPTGIASAEAFGTAVITTGAVDLTPTGIASAEAFGSHVVKDVQALTPSGIASEEAFGTAVLTTGAVDITPSGIASAEAFGTHDVSQATFLTPTGIASAEAFGTAAITTGAVTLTPTGIVSEEAFGSHTIAVAGDKDIKIDFANSKVLNTDLQSTTLYFNGTDYFTID